LTDEQPTAAEVSRDRDRAPDEAPDEAAMPCQLHEEVGEHQRNSNTLSSESERSIS
jgi:hypothetical protein